MKKVLTFLFMLFISSSFVFAETLTYPGEVQFYDNYGSYGNAITTYRENTSYYSVFTTLPNSPGGLVSFQLEKPLVSGYIYSLFVAVGGRNYGGFSTLSSRNYLGLGTSLGGASSSYYNNPLSSSFSIANNSSSELGRGVNFIFTANSNATVIAVPYTTQSTCSNCEQYINGYSLSVIGDSNKLSEQEVNNLISNQTTIIQNNINSLNDNIDSLSDDINSMGQDLIENQNQNNEKLQETIKEQFSICGNNIFSSVNLVNGNILADGSFNPLKTRVLTDYLSVKSGLTYNFNIDSSYFYFYIFEYDIHKNMIIRSKAINSSSTTYVVSDNTNFIRVSFRKDDNSEITPQDIINSNPIIFSNDDCKNRLDDTNNKLDDLNSSLNNSDTNGANSVINDFFGNFNDSDHGGISGIITAPLNAIRMMLSNQCTPLTTTYKGKTISLSCGYSFWSSLGPIQDFLNLTLGGIFVYRILIKLYKLIDRLKNPDDDRVEVINL